MTNTQNQWQPNHLSDDLVSLIPLLPSDFDRLYNIASDPLIWEQHPANDRYKPEVFRQYFDGAVLGKSAFLIIDKATDKLIGCTRYYDYDVSDSSISIGFTFLTRDHWGGHYNKSCKRLLLDYAFQFVNKIYFHIGANNKRSQIATMKFGAIKVREFKAEASEQLTYEYLIHKEDWGNHEM